MRCNHDRLEVVEWTIQMVHRDKNGKDELRKVMRLYRDALKGNFGVACVRGLQCSRFLSSL